MVQPNFDWQSDWRSYCCRVVRSTSGRQDDTGAVRNLLVAPLAAPYPMRNGIEVVHLLVAARLVAEA